MTIDGIGNIAKAPQLGIFDSHAFLNIGMLITEGERERLLRMTIFDLAMHLRQGGQVGPQPLPQIAVLGLELVAPAT